MWIPWTMCHLTTLFFPLPSNQTVSSSACHADLHANVTPPHNTRHMHAALPAQHTNPQGAHTNAPGFTVIRNSFICPSTVLLFMDHSCSLFKGLLAAIKIVLNSQVKKISKKECKKCHLHWKWKWFLLTANVVIRNDFIFSGLNKTEKKKTLFKVS